MNQEIWQQLLALESQDMVKKWFKYIQHRELNTRRAIEITSAAKQSREYFTNANKSSYSVRPLLAFYGVASLSRALALLLKKDGGEEGFTSGHGIKTNDWSKFLSGDLSVALNNLQNLTISTCSGLFDDFMQATNNRMSCHICSSSVDWRFYYAIPKANEVVSLGDLLSLLPDLKKDYSQITKQLLYSSVNSLTVSPDKGFECKVVSKDFKPFQSTYANLGYKFLEKDKMTTLATSLQNFNNNKPQFIHSYIQKTFGAIPDLHIANILPSNSRYSQLCLTYLSSYFLGMLVRYFPTQWMTLVQGGNGDSLWPTINRLQHYVEEAFPELIIELINDMFHLEAQRK